MSAAMDEAPVIRQETGASETPIREYRAIDSIVVADRHRSDLGDLSDLAASIKAIGMLNPVTITADGRLIAGQRRMEACRLLGWDVVPVRVAGRLTEAVDLLIAERDENVCRKEMTPSERVLLGRALEELERPKAKERQGTRSDLGQELPVRGNGKSKYDSRDVIAPAVGFGSSATYSRAKQLVDAAENPDLPAETRMAARAAVTEMDATGKVTPAYEKFKGEPVNRGDDAPTRRDRYGANTGTAPAPKPKPKVVGKTYKGAPIEKAIPQALNTLSGLLIPMNQVRSEDLAGIDPTIRQQWASELTDLVADLRRFRNLLKETP